MLKWHPTMYSCTSVFPFKTSKNLKQLKSQIVELWHLRYSLIERNIFESSIKDVFCNDFFFSRLLTTSKHTQYTSSFCSIYIHLTAADSLIQFNLNYIWLNWNIYILMIVSCAEKWELYGDCHQRLVIRAVTIFVHEWMKYYSKLDFIFVVFTVMRNICFFRGSNDTFSVCVNYIVRVS